METKTISKTKYWLSQLGQYHRETAGFSADIDALEDYELVLMLPVSAWFLKSAPLMFKVFHEKHHRELRRIIAYLGHLSELQQVAAVRVGKEWAESIRDAHAQLNQLIENHNGRK